MRSLLLIVLLVGMAIYILFMFASESNDPKSLLHEGDQAFRMDKDYDKAIATFQAVLDGEGENEPNPAQIRKASLMLLRSQVFKKDYKGMMACLETMDKNVFSLKNYCTIVGDLITRKAAMEAIEVLTFTTEQFPDQKEMLERQAKQISTLNLSNEAIEKLRSIGYLSTK